MNSKGNKKKDSKAVINSKNKKLLISSSDDDNFDKENQRIQKSSKKSASKQNTTILHNKKLLVSSSDDDNFDKDDEVSDESPKKNSNSDNEKDINDTNKKDSKSNSDNDAFNQEEETIKKSSKDSESKQKDIKPTDNEDTTNKNLKPKGKTKGNNTKSQKPVPKKYTQYDINELKNEHYYLAEQLNKLEQEKEKLYFEQVLKAINSRNSKLQNSINDTKNKIEAINGYYNENEYLTMISDDKTTLDKISEEIKEFEENRSNYWMKLRKYKESVKRKSKYDFSPISERKEIDNNRKKVVKMLYNDLANVGKKLYDYQEEIDQVNNEFNLEIKKRNLASLNEYYLKLTKEEEDMVNAIDEAQTIYSRSRSFDPNLKMPLYDYSTDKLDPYTFTLDQITIETQSINIKENEIKKKNNERKKVYQFTKKKWKELSLQKHEMNNLEDDELLKYFYNQCNYIMDIIQKGAEEYDKLSTRFYELTGKRNQYGIKNNIELNLLFVDENSQCLIPNLIEKIDFINIAFEGIMYLDSFLHGNQDSQIDSTQRYKNVIDELEKMRYGYDQSILDDDKLSPEIKEKARKAHDEFRDLLNQNFNDETTKERANLISEDDDLEDLDDFDFSDNIKSKK